MISVFGSSYERLASTCDIGTSWFDFSARGDFIGESTEKSVSMKDLSFRDVPGLLFILVS